MSATERRGYARSYGLCSYIGCRQPAVNARYVPGSWSNRLRILPTPGPHVADLCRKHDAEFGWARAVMFDG